MINKVRNFIVHHNLFANGNKIVYVAVSGGIDSCVLLHILFNLHEEFDYELRIVHFNHNTRGIENLKDEEFVKNLAKDLNLKIAIGRNVKAALKMNEGILRAKRYEYFNTLLDKNENSLIATAHNSDDNIETFLMRLLRGSRLKGLVGIKPKRGNFIRPLLSVHRNQIESYAIENKIKYREDISNKDNSITRNLIRNKLIPSIETDFGNSLKKNILKVIEDLTLHYDLYSEQVQQAVKKTVKTSRYGVSLNKRSYLNHNIPIRRGIVEYCISSVQPLNYGISQKSFLIWDDFIRNASPGRKNNIFEAGYALAERREILFGNFPSERKDKYKLNLNSKVVIDNKIKIELKKINKDEVNFVSDKNVEIIDGEKSGSKLFVRFWQQGDSFRPLGMKNKRKLSDFFIDLKLSTFLKKEIPLICNQDKIIWIAGYRLDDQFKVSNSTRLFYKISISKVNNNDKN